MEPPSCRGVLFLHWRPSGIRWATPSWPEATEANESWNEPGAGMLSEGKWMDLGEWLLQGASPRQPSLIVWAIMLAQWGGWMLGRSHVAWMRPYWLFKLLTWSVSPSWYKDRTTLKWLYINHRANSVRKFQKVVTAKDMMTLLKDQQADSPQSFMMQLPDFYNDLSLHLNVWSFLSLFLRTEASLAEPH